MNQNWIHQFSHPTNNLVYQDKPDLCVHGSKTQGDELKTLPAPEIAVRYYRDGDLYMFDEFQTTHLPNVRRPKIDNLYDVFAAIREDEMEHVKTMVACQEPKAKLALKSPHTQALEGIS